MLDQPLGFFNDHLGDLNVPAGRFIEGRGDDFALDGARHLGDFLGPLIDEQHDQIALRMVRADRGRDVLQQHRLAGLGRRDDQAALSFADRSDEIDGPCRQIFGRAVAPLELEALGRVQRREILEQHLAARALGRIKIDLAHLQQREIALAILGRSYQAGDRVSGAQIEPADLAGADIDIVGAGQVARVRGAQKAEAILQNLQHAIAVDIFALAGMRLENAENDVLLARTAHVLKGHRLGELDQVTDRALFQLAQVHRAAAARQIRRRYDLQVIAALRQVAVVFLRRSAAKHVAVAVIVALTAAAVASAAPLSAAATLSAALSTAGLIAEVASHRLLSRNCADIEFRRSRRILVDIELRDADLVFVLLGDLIENRRNHLAGSAPFRPEIQQYGLIGLQHVFIKRGITGVDNTWITHCGRSSCGRFLSGLNRDGFGEKKGF